MAKIPMRAVVFAVIAAAVLAGAGFLVFASNKPPGANHLPSPSKAASTVTVVAVGDIFPEGQSDAPKKTAELVDQIDPTAILGLGDYQYTTGSCDNFLDPDHYDAVWGRENHRLYPVFGPTHDYNALTANAAGY